METLNLITDSLWPFVGIITLVFMLLFRRSMLKFKLSHISNFITLLIFLFIMRISWNDLMGFPPNTGVYDPDFAGLFFVFMEDFAFIAPGILLDKWLKKSKIGFFLFWAAMSLYFGYEHRLYPTEWMLMVTLYPYFIARKWTLRSSITTVCICHVLYDFSTVLTEIFLRGC